MHPVMSGRLEEARIRQLHERLSQLQQRFQTELRQRGFDPAQADNTALPSGLAKLYTECAELKLELAEIEGRPAKE